MKVLSALVLALPFVLAAPAPIPAVDPHKDTTTALKSLNDQKKQSIKPNGGQYASPYGYYDYTAYPYAQPYAYPAATYDYYSAYPQQADPYYQPYRDDYGYYQQQAAEQAAYEQALKEWKYKKYLYEQSQLRPDLYPESDNQEQQQKHEENKSYREKPRPSANQDYQPARYADYQQRTERPEPAQKQDVDFPLAYKVIPVSDRKYQPEKQQAEREQTPPPKKSAASVAQQYSRFDDFPERQNTNSVRVKQDEPEHQAYFPPEQAYTPREKANPYTSAPPQSMKETEREPPLSFNQYPQPQAQQPQPIRRPEQHSAAPPAREREPIAKAYPPPGPSPNQYTQGPPPPQHIHQERYRNVNNNTPEQSHALQSSPPAHREKQPTSQPPASSSRERPERDQRDRYQETADENEFFNRESVGKKILGKHGYLDNAGAEWVVTISPTNRAVNEGSEVPEDSVKKELVKVKGGSKQ